MAKISWTNVTVNPFPGCQMVSPGCRNCYAERMARRLKAMGQAKYQRVIGRDGKWTGKVGHDQGCMNVPGKGKMVFVNSMGDLGYDGVTQEDFSVTLGWVRLQPYHTFQLLTKRPEQLAGKLKTHYQTYGNAIDPWPMPNLWIGVTCENQEWADKRIPILLQIPAAVRFVSLEPLLGPIDIGMNTATCACCERWPSRWVRVTRPVGPDLPWLLGKNAVDHVADTGIYRAVSNRHGALSVQTPKGLLGIKPGEFECLPNLDLVIIGPETGPGRHPCKIEWLESIVEQCRAAGVPVHVKAVEVNGKIEHDMNKFPPSLRYREDPKVVSHKEIR